MRVRVAGFKKLDESICGNDADTLNALLIWLGRNQAREWLQTVGRGGEGEGLK